VSSKTLIVDRDPQRAQLYARTLHGKKGEDRCVFVSTYREGLLQITSDSSIDSARIFGAQYDSREKAIQELSRQPQMA
jgi:hypothetical protein